MEKTFKVVFKLEDSEANRSAMIMELEISDEGIVVDEVMAIAIGLQALVMKITRTLPAEVVARGAENAEAVERMVAGKFKEFVSKARAEGQD